MRLFQQLQHQPLRHFARRRATQPTPSTLQRTTPYIITHTTPWHVPADASPPHPLAKPRNSLVIHATSHPTDTFNQPLGHRQRPKQTLSHPQPPIQKLDAPRVLDPTAAQPPDTPSHQPIACCHVTPSLSIRPNYQIPTPLAPRPRVFSRNLSKPPTPLHHQSERANTLPPKSIKLPSPHNTRISSSTSPSQSKPSTSHPSPQCQTPTNQPTTLELSAVSATNAASIGHQPTL